VALISGSGLWMTDRFDSTAPVDTGVFTVGVFKDIEWARRGLDALLSRGFPAGALSIIVKESPEGIALVQDVLGDAPPRVELPRIGTALAAGALVGALDGTDRALGSLGIAGTMRRAGFQAHDGQIFERLTQRGGVLVAVCNEPRVSDAIAVLHSYGAGNAAIGAWIGRV
jgi:hypothetical protein